MEPEGKAPSAKRPKGEPIGENLFYSREGNVGRIEFDLLHRGGRSMSGKTIRLFSTEGNKHLPDLPALKVGLNGYEVPA